MSYNSPCSSCRRESFKYPGCPCGTNFLCLPPGYGNFTVDTIPRPVNPTAQSAYITSASTAAFSLSIPSGGGAIPEGPTALPVAGTASILPLNISSTSAGTVPSSGFSPAPGLAPVALPQGSTDINAIQVARAGFYRFDANACFAGVVGTPTSDDLRVLYVYIYSLNGTNRQARVESRTAVGSGTPTCISISGGEFLNAGDRIFFAARQTSVSGDAVPITVFRASVSQN